MSQKRAQKRIIFMTDSTAPHRSTSTAMLKSINGHTLKQPAQHTGPLSHLVPLLAILDERKKKRRRATGKHPAIISSEIGSKRAAPKVKSVRGVRHA